MQADIARQSETQSGGRSACGSRTNIIQHWLTYTEIEYVFSKGQRGLFHNLGDLLFEAAETSNVWKAEDSIGETTTSSMTMMIPEGMNQDASISLWIGRKLAERVIREFKLSRTWSALQSR
jgi:hypothetical protein